MRSPLSPCFYICVLLLASCASDDLRTRTTGVFIDDIGIEHVVKREISADERLRSSHVVVVSVNGVVLLVGQLPTEELKSAAQRAAERVRKVRKIQNEIEVAPPTNIGVRTNDKWMKTKIKTALLASEDVDATRIKVVAEKQRHLPHGCHATSAGGRGRRGGAVDLRRPEGGQSARIH